MTQDEFAEFRKLIGAVHDRNEMISSERAMFAREATRTIRKKNFRFAHGRGIQQKLPGRRISHRILDSNSKIEVAERHPRGFAAPTRLHELPAKWQARFERGARQWSALTLEAAGELKRSNRYANRHEAAFNFGESMSHVRSRKSGLSSILQEVTQIRRKPMSNSGPPIRLLVEGTKLKEK
jgi:hypothetical protein